MSHTLYDVIVVGSGNAGFSAAASAVESGANRVLLLEKAPSSWAGGNTTFTAGAYRTVFHGLQDVLPLVNNVPPGMEQKIDMDPYIGQDFLKDLYGVTNGQTDPTLAATLVRESHAVTKWLAKNGIQFQLSFNRQAFEVQGRQKFWGGMVLAVANGGKGLTAAHQTNCARLGVEVSYNSPVIRILTNHHGNVVGVSAQTDSGGSTRDIHSTGGVVLCAGGFEANATMRAQHLGQGWDLAYVRDTPHNTGELLLSAINDLGAMPAGQWSGCHSTCWDADAPRHAGDQELTNQYTKSGYPLGLMFNIDGSRFVDEGLDMRNYTYAKFGREILQQPDGVAFQVWDAEGAKWLRNEEYSDDVVHKIKGETLKEVAQGMVERGLRSPDRFTLAVKEYNEAVREHRREHPNVIFDPSKKDGLSTRSSRGGIALDKTNWALPLVKGPFLAVKVTCGTTFTFGGLAVEPQTAAVLSSKDSRAIPGLYCAGEMLGGLFYDNYPGGSGLTAGAVFGRIAGRCAAERARTYQQQPSR